MTDWLYFEVTHREHALLNPLSERQVDELAGVLDLRPGLRVVDVGCGHAEMLIRWAVRHGIEGVGVDLSPFHSARAKRHAAERVPEGRVTILEQDGASFSPDAPFDVAMCVGASWIWSGYAGTLDALSSFVRPGSLIALGEPYWKTEPHAEYLRAEKLERDMFLTLGGLRDHAKEQGLKLVWMSGSGLADWDSYEMRQALALDRWERDNPDHPDRDRIRRQRDAADAAYFRWGRDTLGFAMWVFRTPDQATGS